MQRIIPLLKNGCCIFIGAGIPKLIGFPTWQEMARQMLKYTWKNRASFAIKPFTSNEKIELEKMMSRKELIRVLTFCKDRFKANDKLEDYYKKLNELFNDEEKYKNIQNDGYAELLKLGKKSFFVQTNVDLSLEIYIKQSNSISVFVNTSLPTINNIPILSVIYLHGIITDKNSLIFTRDEYDSFYQKNNSFIDFLNGLFNNYDVVFLGYGLGDREILDTVVRTNSQKLKMLALGKTETEKTKNRMFAEFLTNHYRIEVFEYDIELGHEKIIDFLKDLNAKLMEPLSVTLPSEDRSRA